MSNSSATPWTVACQAPLSMGIFQARILEWVAMPSSRGSSQPRIAMDYSLECSWATQVKIRISLNYYHSQRVLFWMKLHVGPKHRPKVEYWTKEESETRLPPGSLMMKQDCNGCIQTRQNHPEGEWLGFSWEARGKLPEGIHTSKRKMCKIWASPMM